MWDMRSGIYGSIQYNKNRTSQISHLTSGSNRLRIYQYRDLCGSMVVVHSLRSGQLILQSCSLLGHLLGQLLLVALK